MPNGVDEQRDGFEGQVSTAVATRTLIASGFVITDFKRQPRHGEYFCERSDLLGATIPYVIAISDAGEADEKEIQEARRLAMAEGRVFVSVSSSSSANSISWSKFLESLGGPVPTWRALSDSYPEIVTTLGSNTLPNGMCGEAWSLFEDAIADGFEFIFGHRVMHYGGQRRGERVVDLITQTPDERILIIDTKATKDSFSVGGPELRPLVEYVKNEKIRHKGNLSVGAVVLTANHFQQSTERLLELNGEFISETSFPLSFLETDVLLKIIDSMKNSPRSRNRLRWAHVFCSGGPVLFEKFEKEYKAASEQLFIE